MSPRTHRVLMLLLVGVGLSRPALWLLGLRAEQAALIQVLASPLPLVFDREGFFAAHTVGVEGPGGRWERLLDGPTVREVRGPLNRRALVTHTLSYGLDLPPALRDPVMVWLLCAPGVLVRELGGPPGDRVWFSSRGVHSGREVRLERACP